MKIYVYGTGCGSGNLIDEALPAEKVAAFVDHESGGTFLGRPVISLDQLAGRDFDILIVASRDAERVESECLRMGIQPEKLFYLKNHMKTVDRNKSYDLACRLLGEHFTERLRCSEKLVRIPLWTEEEKISGPGSDNDYVRLKTLEAISIRLKDIPGAAAELGVNKGGFARWINKLLPERKIFLFDTFSGFDPDESRNCGEGFRAAHSNTAAETVLSVLPHPEKAVICKGLFPKTAAGLEKERFALVSLDADLEESTFAGLEFFMPRISPGGYLMLHDYNDPGQPGVRKALDRWETEHGKVTAVPICDVNGTLVIAV
ncbi:MAG: class I SAM-dependent methyltransferase [Oscillospiraceae bacterium]|nr:class I SAM-dependent methyltransferase [Oscillospiraceae bacterium]